MDHFLNTIAILVPLFLFAVHFHRKLSNLPPTVFPKFPIIGHLYLLKKPLYRSLAKISAKYGPILYLRFGSHRVLLVSSPTITEECFTKNDIVFANRPRWLYGKILASNYTNLSWAPYGSHWRNLRRISTIEIFSSHRLHDFHDVRVNEGRLLIQKLINECSAPVNLNSAFHHMTFNVLIRMITGEMYFGNNLEAKREEFQEIVKEMFQVGDFLNLEDHLAVLNWFGVRRVEKKMIALQRKRNTFFQGLIDELREAKGGVEEGKNKKKNTMIEVLFKLQETDPEYYTDELIKTFLLNLLAAGTDGPVATMEWAFSLLLNHTDVLKKAQREIDAQIGTKRLLDESDIVNLPYLRCIMNETLRMYPPTPLLLPHDSSADCVVGGYHIPRGTILFINQWAIHHDPELWSDPERFHPERFEGFEGTKDPCRFMPFGFGRRSCPGDVLAMRMIGLTLGLLIQCFDWERISEEIVDMSEGLGLSLPKVQSLHAKCRPRSVAHNLVSEALSPMPSS